MIPPHLPLLPTATHHPHTPNPNAAAAMCRTKVVMQDWAGAQASVKRCALAFYALAHGAAAVAGTDVDAAAAASYVCVGEREHWPPPYP